MLEAASNENMNKVQLGNVYCSVCVGYRPADRMRFDIREKRVSLQVSSDGHSCFSPSFYSSSKCWNVAPLVHRAFEIKNLACPC